MNLSLIHPDLIPLEIPKTTLKRHVNDIQSDEVDIFAVKKYKLTEIDIDEIYRLNKICYNSLLYDDFEYIVEYCCNLQRGIINKDNKTIILSGEKSNDVYNFMYYHLKDPENDILPILIVDGCLLEYFVGNGYKHILCK